MATRGESKSNSDRLDSLNKEMQNPAFDSLKFNLYISIIEETYARNPDSVIPLSEQLMGFVENALKTADKDQKYYLLGIKANCFNNIGAIYNQKGDVKNALKNFHESLKLREKLNKQKAISTTLNNLGYLYGSIKDFDNALLYYNRSLEIKQRIDDKYGIARLLNNIGSIYDDLNDTAKALTSYRESYKISESLKDKTGMALSLNNIGFSYEKIGNNKVAFNYYARSLTLRRELGDKKGIAESLNNLGNIYLVNKNETKALDYATQAMVISKELGYPEYIKRSSNLLKEIYLKQKNYMKAYEMYDLYITMRDSIMNEANRDAAVKKSFEYEYEKKVVADSIKSNALQKYENIKHENEINKQRYYTYGGILGFVLMLIVAIVSIKAFKQKQSDNLIITQQKQNVEDKHREITDSINYAERIQRALLASKKILDDNLSNYFILFKPKDVVSGDFYWASKLSNDNFVLVAADSTGHGVPGAIMSILNIACLKEATSKGITSPELILNETRSLVIENLKNDGSAEGGKDGMDGSLLSFDFKNNVLYCASANNPIWIIRGNEFIEIKADRMPIGKHENDKIPYKLNIQSLQKGDVVYALTDGFPDQFGGTSGKKFKYKQLQETLKLISSEPLEIQKQKLNAIFDNWKGNLEQVDDVCIIGVKI